MKYLKKFNETNTNPNIIKFLQDAEDITFLETDKIFFEEDEEWYDGDRGFYLGPVEKNKNCCSDYFRLNNKWIEKIVLEAGCDDVHVDAAENYHILSNISEETSQNIIDRLKIIISSTGLKMIKKSW